jgi:hypothetical protein
MLSEISDSFFCLQVKETEFWFLEVEGERPNCEDKDGCLGDMLLCANGRMWFLATMIAAPHNT